MITITLLAVFMCMPDLSNLIISPGAASDKWSEICIFAILMIFFLCTKETPGHSWYALYLLKIDSEVLLKSNKESVFLILEQYEARLLFCFFNEKLLE